MPGCPRGTDSTTSRRADAGVCSWTPWRVTCHREPRGPFRPSGSLFGPGSEMTRSRSSGCCGSSCSSWTVFAARLPSWQARAVRRGSPETTSCSPSRTSSPAGRGSSASIRGSRRGDSRFYRLCQPFVRHGFSGECPSAALLPVACPPATHPRRSQLKSSTPYRATRPCFASQSMMSRNSLGNLSNKRSTYPRTSSALTSGDACWSLPRMM